jgi:hypothetical protein
MNEFTGDTISDTQVVPTIRPIWIVIGAALLTMCAGISVCFAVSGLGLSFLLSSDNNQSSESGIGQRPSQVVVEAATSTADIPTGIPLPGTSSTLAAPPIGTVNPGSVSIDLSAPAQAVHSYYAAVDANRYDISWQMLSSHFKDVFNCCAPDYNYSGYVDWWDSVDRVDVRNLQTVSQSADRAAVYMELHYTMRSGQQSIDRSYIHLIYDPTVGGWVFDNKTDTL